MVSYFYVILRCAKAHQFLSLFKTGVPAGYGSGVAPFFNIMILNFCGPVIADFAFEFYADASQAAGDVELAGVGGPALALVGAALRQTV